MTQGVVFEKIAHAFGATKVLHDISLSVAPGQILCLLGPSASGKTTLLRLAAGLERLQAGRIVIANTLVAGAGADVPPEQRGVGFVFQDFALFPHLSVADNIAFGLRRHSSNSRRDRVSALIAAMGLESGAGAFPHTLSGGQQQRVALARALAPEPAAMLLDEPFSGLDATLRTRLREDTRQLLKRSHAATVMVTHDAEEAMVMADRIAVIERGQIAQSGAPAEIYRKPATAFVMRLFGEVNELNGIVRDGRVETPFGSVPTPPNSPGSRVMILARPEALMIEEPDGRSGEVRARVRTARLLGRASIVDLVLAGGPYDGTCLRARVAIDTLPNDGDVVAVRVDASKIFVFTGD